MRASEDATLVKSDPDSNFGLEPSLKIRGVSSGPNAQDAVIKFVIPASGFSASTPVDAIVRVYSLQDSSSGGIFHLAPDTGPWSEETVTWSNAPDWETRIDDIAAVKKGQWYTVDVSEAIGSLNGNEGSITIRIRSRDPGYTEYSAKDGLYPPEMVVAYGSQASSGVAASHPYPVAGDAMEPGRHVLTPSDDASIVADRPNENDGLGNELRIDADSGGLESLLRFDLTNINPRAVTAATLRLYCTDSSDSGGTFKTTMVTDWKEEHVTWSNAPIADGINIGSIGPVSTATWYEIDLNALFSSGNAFSGALSIRIMTSSSNRAGYSSKEGLRSPQLVLEINDVASVPTPSPVDESTMASTGMTCATDVYICPDGSLVARDVNNDCKFAPCPSSSGNGLYYPVWGAGGTVACRDGTPPGWATGAYLKETKSECCDAYSMLKVDECLNA